jgi:hypothetical protein
MMDQNITLCNGLGCALTDICMRYLEGQRVKINREGDTNQHTFFDQCDEDLRPGFMPTDSQHACKNGDGFGDNACKNAQESCA